MNILYTVLRDSLKADISFKLSFYTTAEIQVQFDIKFFNDISS